MKWLLSLLCCVVLLAIVSSLVEGSGLRAKPTERSARQGTRAISRKPNSVPTQKSKPPTVSFKLTPQKTRKLTSLAGHRVPLTGNLTYWGEYFANVGLGTPPQYVNLQVDTGSTDLIVYTPDCYGCPNTSYLSYDSEKSSTSNEIQCDDDSYTCGQCYSGLGSCTWEDDYGDGSSIKGSVYTDLFTVGNLTSQSTISLGGITSSTVGSDGFEPSGVDGIWGFAYSRLSGWQGSGVFDHLVGDFNWYDGFSLCMGPKGGVLSLGVDYSKDSRFKWTDISDEIWYSVVVNDIKFGGKSIGMDYYYLNYGYGGPIVDSGTTLFIVTTTIMAAIRTTIEGFCKTTPLVGVCNVKQNQSLFDGQCFTMTPAQVNAFPLLTVTLPGVGDLAVPPSNYLWQGTGVPGQYCMGIQGLDIQDAGIIIGDVVLQGYHVVFDKNLDKIGFGPLSSCPSA